jgi:hypothetical protein
MFGGRRATQKQVRFALAAGRSANLVFENLPNVDAKLPVLTGEAHSVADQTFRHRVLAKMEKSRFGANA